MNIIEKKERLAWLIAKRDHLESTGRYISRTQQREIVKIKAELNKDLENGKEQLH